MKKLFMSSLVMVFSLALFGCIGSSKEGNPVGTSLTDKNQAVNQDENKEFTKEDAIANAIQYHNTSEKVKSDDDFPTTVKPEKPSSKVIPIGGLEGNTTKLDMTVNVKNKDGSYVVTLTENYNVTVNGTRAISYWKYEVSKDNVKLLDKKEDGDLVSIIK